MKRKIAKKDKLASCYFRSAVESPYRKALVQITERCNLHCVHCFVSAGNYGDTMTLEAFRKTVIPRLKECRVIKVTLTGGEPFCHSDILEIVGLLQEENIGVSICTNGTLVERNQIEALAKIGNVRLNVSLDGFRPESHGRFRGDRNSFTKTEETIRWLGQYGLLQGLLVTPNDFAALNEYAEICRFAIRNKATYVLMNPLSSMGRGVKAKDRIGASNEIMQQIREVTSLFSDQIQLDYIRFPNDQGLPLLSCETGNIIYVFVHGEVAVCPYMVFAARTPQSLYRPEEFIVGNILDDSDIAERIDAYSFYERYQPGDNLICKSCSLDSQCGKGCPAAVIASGRFLEDFDREVCPLKVEL